MDEAADTLTAQAAHLNLAHAVAGDDAPLGVRLHGESLTYPVRQVQIDRDGSVVLVVDPVLRDEVAEQVRADIRRSLGI